VGGRGDLPIGVPAGRQARLGVQLQSAPVELECVAVGEAKTKRTTASVTEFLESVADPKRRADATAACALMTEVTGAEPAMWGGSIIGFGTYHYRYATGQESDWLPVGLSPRKAALTLYLSTGFDDAGDLLARLGPHSLGKSCLYIKRWSDVDQSVLRELVDRAFRHLNGQTITTAA
jgi:hypothetical protein